jgi:hypothetical protein
MWGELQEEICWDKQKMKAVVLKRDVLDWDKKS